MFCGVVLAGGVISTAHFAVHHPNSIIGRVLHGASHVAAVVNPVVGLTPLGDHVRAMGTEEASEQAGEAEPWLADPVPVPDDPVPVAGEDASPKAQDPGPIVVAEGGTAPIVICEDERAPMPNPLPVPSGPELPLSGMESTCIEPTGSICPTAAGCPCAGSATAPQVMPYCHDEEDFEVLPMPTEEVEELPMPRPVEEDKHGMSLEQESIHKSRLLRCVDCTNYTDEQIRDAIHHSAQRKLHLFHSDDDECCPGHPEVDTMEFRPSDLHLDDYGPSSL
jgi:hypothetical protein